MLSALRMRLSSPFSKEKAEVYLIEEILVSDDVIEKEFCCDVQKCKGACCYEGDWGAPLEPKELDIIEERLDVIKEFLEDRSLAFLKENSWHSYFAEMESEGTALHSDGSCVFMITDNAGIAQCGIELAHRAGRIDYRKPVSCHLYPIRIKKIGGLHFEALNYSEWDICKPALAAGQRKGLPLYEFAENAIKRVYGEAFYTAIEHAATHGHGTD